MTLRDHLLTLAHGYAAARAISLARVSTLVRNDGKFFRRLGEGAGCTLETYELALAWFDRHWPEDTSWPAEVPRPTRKAA